MDTTCEFGMQPSFVVGKAVKHGLINKKLHTMERFGDTNPLEICETNKLGQTVMRTVPTDMRPFIQSHKNT